MVITGKDESCNYSTKCAVLQARKGEAAQKEQLTRWVGLKDRNRSEEHGEPWVRWKRSWMEPNDEGSQGAVMKTEKWKWQRGGEKIRQRLRTDYRLVKCDSDN